MSTTTVRKTTFFNATRETVWEYLTDKDKLGEWYHPAHDVLVKGQNYTLGKELDDGTRSRVIWGKVLEMDAPSRLVTTFIIPPFGEKETVVTWVLEEAAGGTRLSLTHEGIEEAADEGAMNLLLALDDGWDEHAALLRRAVANT